MRGLNSRACLALLTLVSLACGSEGPAANPAGEPDLSVPTWAKDMVWYQIFVERFRNGDPTNDPTLADMEGSWPHLSLEGWAPTPWGQDWYRQDPWALATGEDFYLTVQLRRYGGDLQGVMDRLDYLQELGVTALYFNPLNDAPSLHKYDARNYRHVDRNFGPDPEGDAAIMASDDPWDPSTWEWTASDRLFLALVHELHRRGMRVIMDYSWNHTGVAFWAWRDVLRNQAQSRFAGWYEIEGFDDPTTPAENEFSYRGWAGVPDLPELKKTGRPQGRTHGAIEGTLVPEVRDHVFAVTRRWLDPNGDGDPSDGIDGFRLDVAEMVPLGFWREYRRFVREINPQAYLVGEVWWEEWPERMYDPSPWLRGDVFDAVMNYRWYAPTRSFFAGAPPHLTATGYIEALDSVGRGFGSDHLKAMMNTAASHDSPRLSTSLFNPGRYKYRVNPRESPDYRIHKPDEATRRVRVMLLVQQFTYLGAPHIWNGDEVGMWGGDDPDCRKPMLWSDLAYEDEEAHPFGRDRPDDPVAPDMGLFRLYQDLIALRNRHLRLFVDGELRFLLADDEGGLLAYGRDLDDQRAVVAFNVSDEPRNFSVEAEDGIYLRAFPTGEDRAANEGILTLALPPKSAGVWIRR